MNKITKIALILTVFTSLVAKAEEMAVEPAQEQAELSESHEALSAEYQAAIEPKLDAEQATVEETILEEAVSSHEAEIPQS